MLVAEKKEYSYHDILYEQERENIRINKKLEQQKKKRAKLKRRYTAFKVVTYSAFSLMTVGVIIFLLMRYSYINELKHEIRLIETSISALEDQYQIEKVGLEEVTKTSIVESRAISELNMNYPKPDQRVYLNVAYDIRANMPTETISSNKKDKDSVIQNLLKKLLTTLD